MMSNRKSKREKKLVMKEQAITDPKWYLICRQRGEKRPFSSFSDWKYQAMAFPLRQKLTE